MFIGSNNALIAKKRCSIYKNLKFNLEIIIDTF